MKKVLTAFLTVCLLFAFVSCDPSTSVENKTGSLSVGAIMTSKAISHEVINNDDISELYWFYTAEKNDDGIYRTGEQDTPEPVKTGKGLSKGDSLGDYFSYGNWTFSIFGVSQESYAEEKVVWTASKTMEINKEANALNLTLNHGIGSVTSIQFGEITFSVANVVIPDTVQLTLKVEDNIGLVTVGDNAISITGNTVTIHGDKLSYSSDSEDITGSHTMVFTLMQKMAETGLSYKVAEAPYNFVVTSGKTFVVKGSLVPSEQQGNVTIGEIIKSVPVLTQSKIVPVTSAEEMIVTTATTIVNENLRVTYNAGVELAGTTETAEADSKITADATTGFVYKGNTLSDASGNVSVSSSESVAQYELTLNVSQENSSAYVIVEKVIEKDLVITKVLHSGSELTKTSNAPESVTSSTEYYSYDEDSGKLTLYVFHASPIDVITVDKSRLPENAKIVMNLEELETAVGNLQDGDYIVFGANIVQNKVDTTSGQVSYSLASGATGTGSVEVTIDLNGFVFDGTWGGLSGVPNLTVNILGVEKSVAEYYKHETGNHMVKACAVFNGEKYYDDPIEGYQTTVLKAGLFESNNLTVMAYGGKVIIDGAEIANTANGAAIYTCNSPTVEIRSGKLSCGQNGALFVLEPFRENEGPSIVINGGVYDASKAAVVFVVANEGDAEKVGSFVVNGGDFTLGGDTDLFQGKKTTRLEIRGGSFNVNPSEYVDTSKYTVTNNGSTWTVTAK